MTDYKQLCAELLRYWDDAPTPSDFIDTNGYGTIQRIRAALAKSKSAKDVTDDNHPIRPPHELVQQWVSLACEYEGNETWIDLATQAARWGADQELDACCEWLFHDWIAVGTVNKLRAARRPKPPSLKEQALAVLDDASNQLDAAHENIIRRALESL